MEQKPQYDFEKFGIGVNDIKNEAEQLIKQSNEAKESKGLFTVNTVYKINLVQLI